jgi:hypothetical protein
VAVRVVVVIVAVSVVLVAGGAASTSGPPAGLSRTGRALWEFEALLHDTFGDRVVCTRDDINFVGGTCAPHATWLPYVYVFADARHSAFHLIVRRPVGSFGNYPVLLRINGKYIACDMQHRTFLIGYQGTANFPRDCLAPL